MKTNLLALIENLPYESAEFFLWRKHAKRRAQLIGGYVVSLPCPTTGKWAVLPLKTQAEDFYHCFRLVRLAA